MFTPPICARTSPDTSETVYDGPPRGSRYIKGIRFSFRRTLGHRTRNVSLVAHLLYISGSEANGQIPSGYDISCSIVDSAALSQEKAKHHPVFLSSNGPSTVDHVSEEPALGQSGHSFRRGSILSDCPPENGGLFLHGVRTGRLLQRSHGACRLPDLALVWPVLPLSK